MDLRQIRYFLALTETLNFTRAAERCHVTQPALTQGIKKLEQELGGELVHRDGKNTRLTSLGKTLRGHFAKIEDTRALIRELARDASSDERVYLNIGLMCTIGPRRLSRLFDRFHERNPKVSLVLHDVVPSAIVEMVLSGALHGAFIARHHPKHDRLRYVSLYSENMVVAFGNDHPFAQREAVTLRDVMEEPYVDRLDCEFRGEFFRYAQREHIPVNVCFSSHREDWIQYIVRSGAGVSIVPEHSILEPSLGHRPVIDPAMRRDIELAIPASEARSPALLELIAQAERFARSQEPTTAVPA